MTPRRTPLQATFTHEKLAISTAVAILAVLVPFIDHSQYGMDVLITMLIVMLLNVSWNFILGVASVWNFGQLAIYAVGGYGAGLIILHTPVPPAIAIIGGGLTGTALAVIISVPTLRLYGIYTSLLTFAAAEVVQLVIENDTTGTTGGNFGLPMVQNLFGTLSPVWNERAWYWTCLGILILALAATALLTRTTFGLALRTLRDSLPYGSARGIAPLRVRVIAFALSGFVAGVAGALYTIYNGSISPTVMGLTPMSIYVTMLVIGGMGTMTGPLIGTAIVTLIEQLLIDHPGTEFTVLGAVLLIVVILFPRGIASEFDRLRRRVNTWMNATEPVAADEPDETAAPATAA